MTQPALKNTMKPSWLEAVLAEGYRPYIATSERFLPYLNTTPFGEAAQCFLLDNPEHKPFHEAYLLANALSYKSPDLKMPNWVLIDCALMQTAIIGFTKPRGMLPDSFLTPFEKDPHVDLDHIADVPVSGQLASTTLDGKSLSGFSLFSLGAQAGKLPRLGLYTKALALEVHQAENYEWLYGIAQYDNPAIRIHGRFSPVMEIDQPIVALHPRKDMTFIYRMAVDYDPHQLDQPPANAEPTFWLDATDGAAKIRMQEGMRHGKRYIIAPPFSIRRDGKIFLPIIEKS